MPNREESRAGLLARLRDRASKHGHQPGTKAWYSYVCGTLNRELARQSKRSRQSTPKGGDVKAKLGPRETRRLD